MIPIGHEGYIVGEMGYGTVCRSDEGAYKGAKAKTYLEISPSEYHRSQARLSYSARDLQEKLDKPPMKRLFSF
jgi:hypothetical protein